jgi:hypothetical protein
MPPAKHSTATLPPFQGDAKKLWRAMTYLDIVHLFSQGLENPFVAAFLDAFSVRVLADVAFDEMLGDQRRRQIVPFPARGSAPAPVRTAASALTPRVDQEEEGYRRLMRAFTWIHLRDIVAEGYETQALALFLDAIAPLVDAAVLILEEDRTAGSRQALRRGSSPGRILPFRPARRDLLRFSAPAPVVTEARP